MGDYKHLLYEVFGGSVACLTLNRPDALNALSQGPGSLQDELNAAMARADADDVIRSIVITGAGRAFCAGADTTEMTGESQTVVPTPWRQYRSQHAFAEDLERIRNVSKPVLAAINGICYGGGVLLAAHCDIRIASDDAKFSMIEGRMGMSGAEILPFLVGPQWAKFLIWTGESISAQRAKDIGLVLDVVPADRLVERVIDLAMRIAAAPQFGVMMNKRNINGTEDLMGWSANRLFSNSHTTLTELMVPIAAGPDGRPLQQILADEGFRAFKAARDAAHPTPWLHEPAD